MGAWGTVIGGKRHRSDDWGASDIRVDAWSDDVFSTGEVYHYLTIQSPGNDDSVYERVELTIPEIESLHGWCAEVIDSAKRRTGGADGA